MVAVAVEPDVPAGSAVRWAAREAARRKAHLHVVLPNDERRDRLHRDAFNRPLSLARSTAPGTASQRWCPARPSGDATADVVRGELDQRLGAALALAHNVPCVIAVVPLPAPIHRSRLPTRPVGLADLRT